MELAQATQGGSLKNLASVIHQLVATGVTPNSDSHELRAGFEGLLWCQDASVFDGACVFGGKDVHLPLRGWSTRRARGAQR